jgi:hypothetical protein
MSSHVLVGQRGDPHADVADQLDERAAHPGHHDRPERGVVGDADRHLDAVADHLLDQERVGVLAEVRGDQRRTDPLDRSATSSGVSRPSSIPPTSVLWIGAAILTATGAPNASWVAAPSSAVVTTRDRASGTP